VEDLDAKYSLYKKTIIEPRTNKWAVSVVKILEKSCIRMYGNEIYLTCGDLALLSVFVTDIIKLTQRQKSAES